MSTEKSEDDDSALDLDQELGALKDEIEELKASVATSTEGIDSKELRRYLDKQARRLGFERDTDLDALRAESARALRLVRRYPASTVGLAAAIGFCAGLLAARR